MPADVPVASKSYSNESSTFKPLVLTSESYPGEKPDLRQATETVSSASKELQVFPTPPNVDAAPQAHDERPSSTNDYATTTTHEKVFVPGENANDTLKKAGDAQAVSVAHRFVSSFPVIPRKFGPPASVVSTSVNDSMPTPGGIISSDLPSPYVPENYFNKSSSQIASPEMRRSERQTYKHASENLKADAIEGERQGKSSAGSDSQQQRPLSELEVTSFPTSWHAPSPVSETVSLKDCETSLPPQTTISSHNPMAAIVPGEQAAIVKRSEAFYWQVPKSSSYGQQHARDESEEEYQYESDAG